MELSAFAHMTGRDVKVVQPGLVYVIEHSAFDDPDEPAAAPPAGGATAPDDAGLDARELRRQRRDRMRADKARAAAARERTVLAQGTPEPDDADAEPAPGPIYVACVSPRASARPRSRRC